LNTAYPYRLTDTSKATANGQTAPETTRVVEFYLERLDPSSKGDIYLTVILGKDPHGLLHVELAGHDGKDHKDDAIAVARDVLRQLQT